MKAHYSGKCQDCYQPILAGEEIEMRDGGWAHLDCTNTQVGDFQSELQKMRAEYDRDRNLVQTLLRTNPDFREWYNQHEGFDGEFGIAIQQWSQRLSPKMEKLVKFPKKRYSGPRRRMF